MKIDSKMKRLSVVIKLLVTAIMLFSYAYAYMLLAGIFDKFIE